ncbi:MBL fold metallo-hydrolase, partial [Arenimonas composti]
MADRNRRGIRGVVAAALVAVLAGTAVAADDPAAPAVPEAFAGELPAGVRLLRGQNAPPRQPDGNSLLFATPAGWLAFDSGRHPQHAQALIALAAEHDDATPAAIVVLVNSHWHLDHVGGNPLLRQAFPRLQVLASPAIDAALAGFLARYAEQLREALAQQPDAPQAADWQAELARIEAGDALRPDRVVCADEELALGGRRFLIGAAAGASDGDLWLLDRERGVLAAGDLVTLPVPFLDTACPANWQPALERLAAQEFTVLVPGHGPPLTRAGLEVYRRAFDRLLACAASPAPEAACIDGWIADAAPLLPDEGQRRLARDMLGYYVPQSLRRADAGRCAPPPAAAR